MQIETLNTLLRKENPTARAWMKSPATVAVTFTENGKVYDYRGPIYRVAESLNLIPKINVPVEAAQVIKLLNQGLHAVGHIESYDTIRYNIGNDLLVDYREIGPDEFGRKTVEYFITKDTGGW